MMSTFSCGHFTSVIGFVFNWSNEALSCLMTIEVFRRRKRGKFPILVLILS